VQVEWQGFKYFVLLSSVVRGPFMPTYLDGTMHWTQPLIRFVCVGGGLCGVQGGCSSPRNDDCWWVGGLVDDVVIDRGGGGGSGSGGWWMVAVGGGDSR
jgi:hypothetical protein